MQVVKLLKKSKTKLNYWRAIKNDGACKLNQIVFENKSKKKKNYRIFFLMCWPMVSVVG